MFKGVEIRRLRLDAEKSIYTNVSTGLIEWVVNDDADEFVEEWAVRAWAGNESYPMTNVGFKDEDDDGEINALDIEITNVGADKISYQFGYSTSMFPSSDQAVVCARGTENKTLEIGYVDVNADGLFDFYTDSGTRYILFKNSWRESTKTPAGLSTIEIDGERVSIKFDYDACTWIIVNEETK